MLELFPSREVAGRLLRARIKDRRSKTYLLTENPRKYERPEQDFPLTETTASLAVWLRTMADGPPGPTVIPDERWSIAPTGGLLRAPWHPRLVPPIHKIVRPEPEPVIPVRAAPPVMAACEACFQIPTVTNMCGCS
jgi:hypothetical protein